MFPCHDVTWHDCLCSCWKGLHKTSLPGTNQGTVGYQPKWRCVINGYSIHDQPHPLPLTLTPSCKVIYVYTGTTPSECTSSVITPCTINHTTYPFPLPRHENLFFYIPVAPQVNVRNLWSPHARSTTPLTPSPYPVMKSYFLYIPVPPQENVRHQWSLHARWTAPLTPYPYPYPVHARLFLYIR